MKHAINNRKLNRSTAHRRSLLRNLATQLVLHNRIETTLPKAKELKRVADKLVTLGKQNTLHARRLAGQFLFVINKSAQGNAKKLTPLHKLFSEIAPRYENRNGGYTRVVRTRVREGDRAQLAVIEFVESSFEKKEKKKRVVKRAASAQQAEVSNQAEQAA